MKRIILLLLASLAVWLPSAAQKMMKPSVMVVPGDAWCASAGYTLKSGGETYPDYGRALVSDRDLNNVISKINILMADRGFPLENLETALKNMKTEDLERRLYTDRSGNAIAENPLDMVYRAAAADIVLQLSWNVNKTGPKNSITFNLQALDSYTAKQVAGVEGTGAPSFSADIPTLLEEAVVSRMDVFCDRLMDYFSDARANGREISIDVLLGKDVGADFNTEFDDYELAEVITRQVARNAVGHSFGKAPSTDTMLRFKSVRMPVADEDGMPVDAYSFARRIMRPLRKEPYNFNYKVISKGLGKAVVVLGEE